MKRHLLVLSLLAVLSVQFAILGARQLGNESPSGPITDSLLPTVPIRFLNEPHQIELARVVTRKHGCSFIVFMSVYCGICQQMRATWPAHFRAWSDSVGRSIQAVWIFGGERQALDVFLAGYDLGGVIAAHIVSDADEAFRRFGVFGTPISYVVDASGRMRVGMIGNRFPPSSQVSQFCG